MLLFGNLALLGRATTCVAFRRLSLLVLVVVTIRYVAVL